MNVIETHIAESKEMERRHAELLHPQSVAARGYRFRDALECAVKGFRWAINEYNDPTQGGSERAAKMEIAIQDAWSNIERILDGKEVGQ